jgi:diphosphomevalonate decarboxylase
MKPLGRPATSRAPANFAFAKYWGKSDEAARHPAVPSVSACVLGLEAWAEARFEPDSPDDDVILLRGRAADTGTTARVRQVLDAVRARADIGSAATVNGGADFAIGAGLASSAAGLAAVTGAVWAAAGLDPAALNEIAEIARLGSGSACRSVFGGFVAWEPTSSGSRVRQIAPAEHWPLDLCLVQIDTAKKEISSTEGMRRASATSSTWQDWLDRAPADAAGIEASILGRDIERLSSLAEANCKRMHETTRTARPPFSYLQERSLLVMDAVAELRRGGLPCFFTADAGPNVKVFCKPGAGEKVRAALIARVGDAAPIALSAVGPGLRIATETPS